MNPIVTLVIQQMPNIIAMIKAHHEQVQPLLPPLTDAEALEILQQAVTSSLAKDALWQAAHGG